jgi:hypothetical protein
MTDAHDVPLDQQCSTDGCTRRIRCKKQCDSHRKTPKVKDGPKPGGKGPPPFTLPKGIVKPSLATLGDWCEAEGLPSLWTRGRQHGQSFSRERYDEALELYIGLRVEELAKAKAEKAAAATAEEVPARRWSNG